MTTRPGQLKQGQSVPAQDAEDEAREARARMLETVARAYADKPEIAADARNRARAERGDRLAQLRAEHKGRRILAGWTARGAERGREYRDRSVTWLRAVVTTAVRPRERRDASGRSGQRSGDGGSDSGPSGPSDEPPLARRRRAGRRARAPPARSRAPGTRGRLAARAGSPETTRAR